MLLSTAHMRNRYHLIKKKHFGVQWNSKWIHLKKTLHIFFDPSHNFHCKLRILSEKLKIKIDWKMFEYKATF